MNESSGFDFLAAASQSVIVFAIVVAAIAAYVVARRYFLAWVHLFVSNTKGKIDDALVENKVPQRACMLLPLLVIYVGAGLIFPHHEPLEGMIRHVALALMILVGARIVDALINTGVAVHGAMYSSGDHPDTFFVAAVKALVYVSALFVAIATLTETSLTGVLTGLGAMSALLMLIFKDVLLGFVSGIQLRSKDLIRRGDYILVSKFNVEGTVTEVGLNSVIVQNADKAYINIPNYVLVSESFTNLRGVNEAGGRRIRRAIKIDLYSVGFCDPKRIESMRRVSLVADYLKEKEPCCAEGEDLTGITNLDVFRRYVRAYLGNHPKINASLPFLVRQLAPTETGVSIEVSVFTKEKDAIAFEELQAEIFDHLFAVVPYFGLRMFQIPSGYDLMSRPASA